MDTYEKKYKEALELARDYYKANLKLHKADENAILEDIFPELAESEDERIRKWIINEIKIKHHNLDEDNVDFVDKAIAWLEKQGEQKSADKVEPKFKVGDWITNGHCKCQITFIDSRYWYSKTCVLGNVIDIDKTFHLWTIQDAKDGDVLLFEGYYNSIVLFQGIGINGKGRINYHCKCDLGNYSFGIQGDAAYLGTIEKDAEHYHPATKEQRDLLFSKMEAAGYKWDAEKKKLKQVEQKSSWSEEDEKIFCSLLNTLTRIGSTTRTDTTSVIYSFYTEINWLKSLKERFTWKPSEHELEVLRLVAEKDGTCLMGLYEQLKKLKGD